MAGIGNIDESLYNNPSKLLQLLIRYKTVNPPGNESECIGFLKELFEAAGFEPIVTGKDKDRENLLVILKGRGEAAPFLMYGHIDVVTAEGQEWKYPPFDGIIEEDCVWGRGALDMKGAIAMMIAAMLRVKAEGIIPSGDIILCILSDEEEGGDFGAKYMIENHKDLFKGVRYAIGEIGGFTMHIGKKRFYPIMVAEKQRFWFNAKIKGSGGHGSIPVKGGAVSKLAGVIKSLDESRLPVHITPPAKLMIENFAKNMPFPAGIILKLLLKPGLTDMILGLLGDKGKFFDPILHNTVNITKINGGNKFNVVPGEITVSFDGRLLPGYKPEDMLSELNSLLKTELEYELLHYDSGPDKVDMGMYDKLAGIIKECDTEAVPVPFIISGATDARLFSALGIQTYGFTPMLLPKEIDFAKLFHGANERIPIKAMNFGTEAIYKLLKSY